MRVAAFLTPGRPEFNNLVAAASWRHTVLQSATYFPVVALTERGCATSFGGRGHFYHSWGHPTRILRKRKQEVPERQRQRLSIARYHTCTREEAPGQQRKHATHNMRTNTAKDHEQMSIAIGCP